MGEGNILEDEQIDLFEDGGILKKIIQEGDPDSQPSAGCRVSIHYTSSLLDGTKFDSSLDRKGPFSFELGKGTVVKGFDMCVASMQKGEKAVFTVKPEYAYGATGNPPNVPKNATIIYEMELLDWKTEDLSPRSTGGILRIGIKAPTSKKTMPNDGASVSVKLIGLYEDRVFDERDLTFTIGEVTNDEVIQGIQMALTHFGKGETSKLIIKPEFAFGQKGNEAFGIPPNATVEYEVTLKRFERGPDAWKMDAEESLAEGKFVKKKATAMFKKGKYELAIKMYEKSNTFLSNCIPKPSMPGMEIIEPPSNKNKKKESQDAEDSEGSDEFAARQIHYASKGEDREAKIVKAANFSNIALCHLKLKNYDEAKKACEEVLEIDPDNVKAYFRRGTSLFETGEPAAALEDFQKVLELEPENRAAINQITLCKQEIKRQYVKEKKLCANIFSKLGDDNTE